MAIFKPFNRAHGVDVSDLMIRVAEASYTKKGIRIFAYHEVPVEPGIIVEGEIKKFDDAKKKLESLYKNISGHLDSPFAIVAVPERKTFTKVVKIDKLPPEEIDEAIRWEAEQHFPVSLDDMYLTWSPLAINKDKQLILLSATDQMLLEQYVELFSSINKHIIVAEPESFAIQRTLLTDNDTPSLIIDLGASKTSLSIVVDGVIQYTSTISFSGRELTLLIAKELNLSEEQAEKAKTLFGLNETKSKGVVRKLLLNKFAPLIDHVKEVLLYYQTNFELTKPITNLILCGGGSQMEGIHTYLGNTLSIASKKISLPVDVTHRLSKTFATPQMLSYTTAIGLALRNDLQNPFEMISKNI